MTAPSSRIHDADLMAYLDGSLDAARVAAFEARLAQDQEAQDRLAHMRRQNEQIGALYEPVMAEPVPARLDVRGMAAAHRMARRGWMRVAAAALLCLFFGGAGGWYFGQRSAGSAANSALALTADAFAAHRLYTKEVVHPVTVSGNPGGHLATWLSRRLDRRLTIPDLTDSGWRLVGGSLLPAGAMPAAQIMYQDEAGRRLTLFITPARAGTDSSPRFARAGNLNALFWAAGGVDCTIVGPLDYDTMTRIAAEVYNELTS